MDGSVQHSSPVCGSEQEEESFGSTSKHVAQPVPRTIPTVNLIRIKFKRGSGVTKYLSTARRSMSHINEFCGNSGEKRGYAL